VAFRKASRGDIAPFMVMDVMRDAARKEAEGGSVIHLEVGQPTGQAPRPVLDVAAKALAGEPLGYTLALGHDGLRGRIARHYADRYGARVAADSICVTVGSSSGFLLAFLAAFEVGQRVAVAAPGYPAYRNILKSLGVECVNVPVGADSRWQLTRAALEGVEGPLHGVVVASPSNPTGSMLDAAELANLAHWCESHSVRLISDEIYHGITYGQPAVTMAGRADAPHAVVVNSFSKYYAMTGWRLGWMVMPPDLVRSVECLQQNLFISAPTLSQLAAIKVFDCEDELDARVARYGRNRDILLNELPGAGFDRLASPDGAFFLYADISAMTDDSQAFCRRMLAEIGVAATPGVDFDPFLGHASLRFSYAGSEGDMIEAARRLRAWKR
jgi:aspartate/methionine/tyrosine aminotransferase